MFDVRNLRWSWSCLLHTCSYYISAKNQTNLPIVKQVYPISRCCILNCIQLLTPWVHDSITWVIFFCLYPVCHYFEWGHRSLYQLTFVSSPIQKNINYPKLGKFVVNWGSHFSNNLQLIVVNRHTASNTDSFEYNTLCHHLLDECQRKLLHPLGICLSSCKIGISISLPQGRLHVE